MRPDEIANTLRRAVRERILLPGQALNQDELARRFEVSRIPLREALRTLVGEGLVVMKPGLGAVVTELSAEEVDELYGLRLQLEPPLAGPVIAHVRRRDIDDLDELVTRMGALARDRSEEWANLNYRFHRRLYELAELPHTLRLVVQLLNLVEPYARLHAHVLDSRRTVQNQHAAKLAALRESSVEALTARIQESIAGTRAELIAAMSEAERSPSAEALRKLLGA